MIKDANEYDLTQIGGTLPSMSDTLMNYFQNTTFIQVVTAVVNGQAVETETETCFMGVVESVTPQDLMMKPEGQRDWNWINVWALPSLILRNDEIIKYNDVRYRVMKKWDWNKYGYVQYDLVEDYESKA